MSHCLSHCFMISIFIPNKTIPPNPTNFTPKNQKTLAYFDEVIHGFVSAPSTGDFDLNLEIFIVPNEYDDISKFSIQTLKVEKLVFQGDQRIYEFETPINYPKKKLNNPKIIFNAVMKTTQVIEKSSKVPDFQPKQRNLLSELAVVEHQPIDKQELQEQVIETKLDMPIITPLLIKLKSTKPAGKNNILLISFTIEASELLLKLGKDMILDISKFNIDFKGNLKNLNLIEFPLKLNINESINLNYRLVNFNEDSTKQLNIEINLKVHEPEISSNIINTSWFPVIDFNLVAPPINQSLKTTQSSLALTKKRSPTIPRRIGSNVTVNLNNSNLYGLKLSFIGKLTIETGEIVHWKVQAINQSFSRLNLSIILNKSDKKRFPNSELMLTYPNVVNYQNYSNLKGDNYGVVVLDNDIRLLLEGNSVVETEIKLLGISKGIHNLNGLNVYDLSSGDCIDFGKLVEVFVVGV